MTNARIVQIVGIAAAISLAPRSVAHAQDLLQTAKTHYEAAAYEEALATLGLAGDLPGHTRVEVEQYRAMSLLALGRTAEATAAVEALVAADPEYVPSPSIASPKVQSLIAQVRREQLPIIVRSLVGRGRAALEQRAVDGGTDEFSRARKLLADPVLQDWPEREDVRVLVEGFAALASARQADANAPRAPAPAANPGPLAGVIGVTGATSAPTAPAPELAAAGLIEPPVAILQTMPPWIPPDVLAQTRGYEGILKIEIGTDGRVKSARIDTPSHPAYDARLLHAARQWVFKPASRDGLPVESEKVIAIQLHPRDNGRSGEREE